MRNYRGSCKTSVPTWEGRALSRPRTGRSPSLPRFCNCLYKQKKKADRPTVLIAETCELNRRILSYLLERRFNTIETADEEGTVLQLSRRRPGIACIIVGFGLLTTSSKAMMQSLAALGGYCPPVIVIQPRGHRLSSVADFPQGVTTATITTPFKEVELTELVDACLAKHTAT